MYNFKVPLAHTVAKGMERFTAILTKAIDCFNRNVCYYLTDNLSHVTKYKIISLSLCMTYAILRTPTTCYVFMFYLTPLGDNAT